MQRVGMNSSSKNLTNKFRIIGGHWRSRTLAFPSLPGLRPTPDRVRETLFNWLQLKIVGANCVDLFAGSGALSFEALSRGARHVTSIDAAREAVAGLEENARLLKAQGLTLIQDKAQHWLQQPGTETAVDIVFMDPPFADHLLPACCRQLEASGILAAQAYIYLETDQALQEDMLPANWEILKHKKAGQVQYYLCRHKA